jgi:hypothetical protein
MEYIVPSMVRHPLGGTCLVKVAQLCGHEVRYLQAKGTSIYEGRFPRRSRSGFTSV